MNTKINLTWEDIKNSLTNDYELLNSVLYDLCEQYFDHSSKPAILAKTILIGRTYSVSLDRGKDKGKKGVRKKPPLTGDEFYQNKIVPIFFLNSDLDKYIGRLKNYNSPKGQERIVLTLHNKLMKLLLPINGEKKISFSSKYLHFHLQHLFFIYDTRAKSIIDQFINLKDVDFFNDPNFDPTYSRFFSKALKLQEEIEKLFKVKLTPRQIDNLLLRLANKKLREKLLNRMRNKLSL